MEYFGMDDNTARLLESPLDHRRPKIKVKWSLMDIIEQAGLPQEVVEGCGHRSTADLLEEARRSASYIR